MTTTGPFYLAFDIGGTHVRVALGDQKHLLKCRISPWPIGCTPLQDLAFLVDLARTLTRECDVEGKIAAAAFSLPALLHSGSVRAWPNRSSWEGLAFVRAMEETFKVPIQVEDDANTTTLAEWSEGAGVGCKNLLTITAGTGIGAGIVLDGALVRGQNGWAGEIGHTVVMSDGPECSCGHRGCLQAVASGRALDRIACERNLQGGAQAIAALAESEAWARETLTTAGRWLGLAAANAVHFLDVELVVIGGGLLQLGDIWWSAIRDSFRQHLSHGPHRTVNLCPAALSTEAGLIGALRLARQSHPVIALN